MNFFLTFNLLLCLPQCGSWRSKSEHDDKGFLADIISLVCMLTSLQKGLQALMKVSSEII